MASDFNELLERARNTVTEIEPDAARRRAQSGEAILIDVREDDEWMGGHLPGAHHVSRGTLEMRIGEAAPDKDAEIVLYCAGGNRSLLAGQTLHAMGYTRVASMAGGINAWRRAGLPIVQDPVLSLEQQERYSRHLSLPQVGREGQIRLMEAKALLVGAGGLGSPAALYLAAAGVGTLGIIDHDRVDRSNLQRQVLHDTLRIGAPKAESAKESLERLNPDVTVNAYVERLTGENVTDLVRQHDVILDGSDNFETRYLLNDTCHAEGKPLVHGSIYRFEGQMSVFHPREGGPCYRCLFPETAGVEHAPT